ncbi:BrnT family toxin [Jiella mangrovi]|uniref:BrnT family toxin n=1 Tax=Jiella mangrovi TaxID=2821407 RepID=A0ABS4BFL0_9HYPH|nr:BrnT family toxin [Jiella mangrovi]MBP0615322.1 BrnT family toxin [Jiella mangrovi]
MRVAGFDWDAGNWPKCGKHGVGRAEIEQAIRAADFRVINPHPTEERWRIAAPAISGRYVFAVITYRETTEGMLIRPISARYMHRDEVKLYEQHRQKALAQSADR